MSDAFITLFSYFIVVVLFLAPVVGAVCFILWFWRRINRR